MIKYALKCADGHSFESWFQNGEAYDRLAQIGQLSCAVCGTTKVGKAIMAPRVGPKSNTLPDKPLSAAASPAEQKLKDLRREFEKNSENVGDRFVEEVRDMHYGDTPHRSVHGRARIDEAKELWDEGIPVAPLPWSSEKPN